jgi:hypothetical protein
MLGRSTWRLNSSDITDFEDISDERRFEIAQVIDSVVGFLHIDDDGDEDDGYFTFCVIINITSTRSTEHHSSSLVHRICVLFNSIHNFLKLPNVFFT